MSAEERERERERRKGHLLLNPGPNTQHATPPSKRQRAQHTHTPNSCASAQGDGGRWNRFGGRLAWDATAVCSDNPAWGGRGGRKTGDDYPAAPNIDHTQV